MTKKRIVTTCFAILSKRIILPKSPQRSIPAFWQRCYGAVCRQTKWRTESDVFIRAGQNLKNIGSTRHGTGKAPIAKIHLTAHGPMKSATGNLKKTFIRTSSAMFQGRRRKPAQRLCRGLIWSMPRILHRS